MSDQLLRSQRFLPVALRVEGEHCIVVGGGAVGTRKALTLTSYGAHVTVIAPDVTDELKREIRAGRVTWIENGYRRDQLEAVFLVVAATNDPEVNAAVVRHGRHLKSLACDASSKTGPDVMFGALLEHDGRTIAVFTDGRDPAAARQTRDRLAASLRVDGNQGKHE